MTLISKKSLAGVPRTVWIVGAVGLLAGAGVVAAVSLPGQAPLEDDDAIVSACVPAKAGERILVGVPFHNTSGVDVTVTDVGFGLTNAGPVSMHLDLDPGARTETLEAWYFPSDDPQAYDEADLARTVDPAGAVIKAGTTARLLAIVTAESALPETTIGPAEMHYRGAGRAWSASVDAKVRIGTESSCSEFDDDDDDEDEDALLDNEG